MNGPRTERAARAPLLPGDCLTLFTTRKADPADALGLFLRWRWHAHGGFDPGLRDILAGHEVREAYENSVDIVFQRFGHCPRGLSLDPIQAADLRSAGIRLSGSSLGLAFLLGALSLSLGISWPLGCVAWGDLRPTRKNDFTLYPVDEIPSKTACLGREVWVRLLVHPAAEGEVGSGRFHELLIATPVEQALAQLITLLKRAGDDIVH